MSRLLYGEELLDKLFTGAFPAKLSQGQINSILSLDIPHIDGLLYCGYIEYDPEIVRDTTWEM